MDFIETQEQGLIRESIRKLCSGYPDDYWEQCDREKEYPLAFFSEVAKAGWIGIAMPEKYGGAGKGIQEAATVLVAAFEEQEAKGAMAFKFNGEMVDVPHLKRAQQVLARRNDAGNN